MTTTICNNTRKSNNFSKTQKVDMIFSYIFSPDKNLEEQDFWNKLSKQDLSRLESIEKEEVSDFSLLRNNVLWK